MSDASQPNLNELLQRAQAGDRDCLDRLFSACRGYLGVAARAQVETWLQAKVDASDLVQQTMLEAHRDFERFQGETEQEWWAWLRRILKHNVADFVRSYKGTAKRQVRREVRLRSPGDGTSHVGAMEPVARDRSPSQQIAQVDEVLRVSRAVESLSDDHREVIMLRNLHRLSFSEIAEKMDRTRPAVQMLWMRAIKKLQETVAEAEDSVS